MPESPVTSVAEDREYYEERVVEGVDNRRTRTILSVFIALLILLLVGVGWFVVKLNNPVKAPLATELPEGVDWVRSIYAWGTTSKTLFRGPVDVAVAPNGTIWTVTNKQVIAGFAPDGRASGLIAPIAGKGKGQVVSFEGLTVADNGEIYVADFGRKVIMVFSAGGQYVREFPTDDLPTELYVRGDKVAIATISGVEVRTTSGKLLNKWGKRGSGDIGIDGAHGILIGADGTVYLSDTNNARVRAFTPAGRPLWTRGGTRRGVGNAAAEVTKTAGVSQSLQIPTGMTMDESGRLLVVDPFEFQILALDTKNGRITARYGEFGTTDGKFAYPTGIAYDRQRGTVMVADTANDRVQIIRLPGTGGSAIRRFRASFFDQPVWLCLFPLALLVIASVVFLRRRSRSARSDSRSDDDGQE